VARTISRAASIMDAVITAGVAWPPTLGQKMEPTPEATEPVNNIEASAAIDAASSTDNYLEVYKLAVEMADRISARRGVANSFFLTINTAILGLLGTQAVTWYPAAAGITVCITWWALLRSYRELNRAKFDIILELEDRLPAQLYGREWALLRKGKVSFQLQPPMLLSWLAQYKELGYIESIVPWVFSVLYVVVIILKAVH
jgi:hypothetical protein